ncbi:MAG: 3-isopropylmalate dehydrogenase [Candidatus Margulisbacteria bacterium]|nr:3-isopropylmalate dehydrogenase [Candidatus Margulisiibacteriota bacterium]
MHYKLAIIPGDGTGPEVVQEGLKVLKAVESAFDISFEFTHFDWGGSRYLKSGKILDDDELDSLKAFDAAYLGAIGHPDVKPGILEKGILLKSRFDLDQYINLRPVKLYPGVATPISNIQPEDIDYLIVRENTGGLYTGKGHFSKKGTPDEVAVQEMIYTRHQVERCVRYAFESVLKRHKDNAWRGLSDEEKKKGYVGQLTLCVKTNVLTFVYDLWQRVVDEVAEAYPTVKTNYVNVDATCIWMIEDPGRFDVIVTGNMFGDIISDLAAVTQGGLGIAPGGNINPKGVSMFEPIGGTAPQFTGQNSINPLAAIGAAGLMLDHLGAFDAAKSIDQAISKTVTKMTSMRAGEMGLTTSEVGDSVAGEVVI